jgi:hypothetical protein
MSKFNVGDKVLCIRDTDSRHTWIQKNNIYTVSFDDGRSDYIGFLEDPVIANRKAGHWLRSRYVPMSVNLDNPKYIKYVLLGV